LRHVCLSLGGAEIRCSRIGRRFNLVILSCGDGAGGNEAAIARLIAGGFSCARPGGINGLALSQCLQLQVGRVQPHQRLTAFNGLAGINNAFEDLTLHPETKIALRSCDHHAGKGTRSLVRKFYGRDLTSGGRVRGSSFAELSPQAPG
jgi:hypothetical protein